MASKTPEEIQALKDNWFKDPCWDIETTEGFEEYHDELLAFRLQSEKEWKVKSEAKVRLTFEHRAGQIEDEIDALECAMGDMKKSSEHVMAREQIRAILLLAEQSKRIADALEEMGDRDSLAESVNLWKR